jgi:hypothetical protein
MTTRLGVTFACRDDFDAQFRLAQTDREIIGDEVYHRLTADRVTGDSEEAQNFGRDVRRLAGARMSDTEVAELGPTLSAILQRSGRVETADVTVTKTTPSPGLIALQFAVSVTAVTGDTFDFLFLLTPDTFEQIGAP